MPENIFTNKSTIVSVKRNPRRRAQPQDIDRHVGERMRDRRIMLGLTQQQMASLMGITYQQINKYERGINRIAASRLWDVARVLGVDILFFFPGGEGQSDRLPSQQQQMLFELARNFIAISSHCEQEALCAVARTLAESDRRHGTEPDDVASLGARRRGPPEY